MLTEFGVDIYIYDQTKLFYSDKTLLKSISDEFICDGQITGRFMHH